MDKDRPVKKKKFATESNKLIKEYELNKISLEEFRMKMSFLRGVCNVK